MRNVGVGADDTACADSNVFENCDIFSHMNVVFEYHGACCGQGPLGGLSAGIAVRLIASIDAVIVIRDVDVAAKQHSVSDRYAIRAADMNIV